MEIVDDAFLCAKTLDGWSDISAKDLARVHRFEDDLPGWSQKCLIACVEAQEMFAKHLPKSAIQTVESRVRGYQLQAVMNKSWFNDKVAKSVGESAKRLEYTIYAFFNMDEES